MNSQDSKIERMLEQWEIEDLQGWASDLRLYGAAYAVYTPNKIKHIPAVLVYIPVGWDERDAKV